MRTIVRIEHDDGNGIFRGQDDRLTVNKARDYEEIIGDRNAQLLLNIWNRHDANNPTGGFPMPFDDGIDLRMGEETLYYAFKDLTQLYDWIRHEEIIALIECGFKVLVLQVNNYQEGGHQMAFTKNSIVNTLDISHLFINN